MDLSRRRGVHRVPLREAALIVAFVACGGAEPPPTRPAPLVAPPPVASSSVAPAPPSRPSGRLLRVSGKGVTLDDKPFCGAPTEDVFTDCTSSFVIPKLATALGGGQPLVVELAEDAPIRGLKQVLGTIENANIGTFTLGDGSFWRAIANHSGAPPKMAVVHFVGKRFYVSSPKVKLDDRCAGEPKMHDLDELAACAQAISGAHPELTGVFLGDDMTVKDLWRFVCALDKDLPLAIAGL